MLPRPGRQHPARAVFALPGREAGPGVGRRERLGDEQRRLVIAAAERGAIEQVEAAVVAGDGQVVLALVPEDHRRGVEVGLVAGEPVLHLERDPIEGDDRVRVARRGRAAGGEPRARRRRLGAGGGVDDAARPERHASQAGDVGAARLPLRHLLLRRQQIDPPDGVGHVAAAVRGARVDEAVDVDDRRRPRVGRQERHRRIDLAAVGDAQRAQQAVAADDPERIDAAEGDAGHVAGGTGRRWRHVAAGRALRPRPPHLAQRRGALARLAHGAGGASAAAAETAAERRRRARRPPARRRDEAARAAPRAARDAAGRRGVGQVGGPVPAWPDRCRWRTADRWRRRGTPAT